MSKEAMLKVIEAFKARDNFLISSHVNPEGDSVGSQIAVYSILKALGKKAVMVDHDKVPENLKFLESSGDILNAIPEDFSQDTVVILDCPVKDRIGKVQDMLKGDEFMINIDHHVSNGSFADVNWIEKEASSVGEMIFCLIKELGLDVSSQIGEAIYSAIVTDTGMFNYDNTLCATHEVAGELISKCVNPKKIHNEIFEKKSFKEIKLLARSLSTLELADEGRIAYMTLTREMYDKEGIKEVSTDEFINYPRSIKGVEVAVFFKENGKERKVNVSFRSLGKVDVNTIAAGFGGGGHSKASGCVLECGLEEAKEKVLTEVKKTLS